MNLLRKYLANSLMVMPLLVAAQVVHIETSFPAGTNNTAVTCGHCLNGSFSVLID